jgi:hypothetical protein
MTFSIVLLNLVIDVCYTLCDPRVRARASVDEEDRLDAKFRQPARAPAPAHAASRQ